MSAKRIKSTSLLIDIILTVILAIAIGVGIGVAVMTREVTHSGELTIENYAEYIDVHCGLSGFKPSSDFTCNYDIKVETKFACEISDFEMTVEVISDYSDFGTYTLKTDEISYYSYIQSGKVHYSLDFYPGISWRPNISVRVLSVSGKYSYTTRGE